MENFRQFSTEDQGEALGWVLGFFLLATMFVVLMSGLPERIGCVSQVGLFIIFLLIGALTSRYFYLVLPLCLVTQAVVTFAARTKPRE